MTALLEAELASVQGLLSAVADERDTLAAELERVTAERDAARDAHGNCGFIADFVRQTAAIAERDPEAAGRHALRHAKVLARLMGVRT